MQTLNTTAATASTPSAKAEPAMPQTAAEHVRETADSIVVAFILAFVFRAFVIEAFVIPTGSMAATLYGRHGTMICYDCGWQFAYGLTDTSSDSPGRGFARENGFGPNDSATCPNCAHTNAITQINDRRGNSEAGDRILALKWPYDIGGEWLGPKRWDVALFKDPSDRDPRDGVTNFIKRLAGLPNEVLEIIDGDLFVAPIEKLSPQVKDGLDKARRAKYLREKGGGPDLAEATAIEEHLRPMWPGILEELSAAQEICRKTPMAQKTLWNVVYDHDYPPRALDRDQPVWAPAGGNGGGWKLLGRKLRFEPSGAATGGLGLFNRPVLDSNGYNLRSMGEPCGVTDLRLRMVLTPRSGDGALLLKLPKRGIAFWAEIGTDGTVRLFKTAGPAPNAEPPLATAQLAGLEPGQSVTLDFQNVDHRASLAVNGIECVATTPAQFSPDIRAQRLLVPEPDPGQVQILARGAALELSHVVVERDVFYRTPSRNPAYMGSMGALSRLTGAVWGGTGNPIWLREGEYFMLGDNSAASGDSRLWSEVGPHLEARGENCQLGTVPADQLIGRAFFVYWPSGHRSDIIPFLDNFGLIPDVGRMRWIR